MLDDGRGGGATAAALVRMALLLLVLLGCIRAGRCLVDTTVPEKVGFHRNLA